MSKFTVTISKRGRVFIHAPCVYNGKANSYTFRELVDNDLVFPLHDNGKRAENTTLKQVKDFIKEH